MVGGTTNKLFDVSALSDFELLLSSVLLNFCPRLLPNWRLADELIEFYLCLPMLLSRSWAAIVGLASAFCGCDF